MSSAGSVSNPFGFAGGVRDPSGLVKFGTRYYTPWVGRWTQQDAMGNEHLGNGSAESAADRYLYVNNDPANNTDVTGGGLLGDIIGGVIVVAGGVLLIVVGGSNSGTRRWVVPCRRRSFRVG